MGKAKIVSGGSDGFYSIRRIYDTDARDRLIAKAQKAIDQASADIAKLESDLSALESEADTRKAQTEQLIEEYVAELQTDEPDLPPFQERLEEAQLEAFNLTREITPVQAELDEAKARKLSAEKKLAVIEGANPDEEAAFCADFTEDLSPGTEVATIELPGEPQTVVIAPAGRAHEPDDGILMPPEWMTPAQAFFNTAILPGVQRWRPFFRTGRIFGIDYEADTCSLTLVDERSNWQRLPVNELSQFTNVPIEYMTCDALPFLLGDQVVVELQTDFTPVRVIGFPAFPQPCIEREPRRFASEPLVGRMRQQVEENSVCSKDPPDVLTADIATKFHYSSLTFEVAVDGFGFGPTFVNDSKSFGFEEIPHPNLGAILFPEQLVDSGASDNLLIDDAEGANLVSLGRAGPFEGFTFKAQEPTNKGLICLSENEDERRIQYDEDDGSIIYTRAVQISEVPDILFSGFVSFFDRGGERQTELVTDLPMTPVYFVFDPDTLSGGIGRLGENSDFIIFVEKDK